MTETADRYRRLAAQFTEKVAAVPDNAWSNQSPCPEWTARDVVQHVIDSTCYFLSWVNQDVDAPSVEQNPMAAWSAVRETVQDCLEDPAIAQQVLERQMGTGPFEQFVDDYLMFDLVVHAWDLSRAAGIDDRLDETTVAAARIQAESIGEMGRKMGAFGEVVDVSDSSDEQTKLLALVGRRR